MPEATLKFVAKLAGVAPVTVSRVVNGSENVAPGTREKILAIIRDLDYAPNVHAANLRRKSWNNESTNSQRREIDCSPYPNMVCPPEGAFMFSPEEGRAFVQQVVRLRRDLDTLRKHIDRIETCVESIEEACSRQLSSTETHLSARAISRIAL